MAWFYYGEMSIIAVTYDYRADNPQVAENRAAHDTFLSGLRAEGQIVASGPFTDSKGGELIVLRLAGPGESTREAIALLDRDPYFRSGCITARSFRTWQPSPDL